jgi:membrane protein
LQANKSEFRIPEIRKQADAAPAPDSVDLAARFVSVSPMPSNRFSRLLKILASAVTDADEIIQPEGPLERFVHFCALVTRQFIRNRCFVRASALSFSTLLAIIPLLAVALSVTSSLLSTQNEAKLTQFVESTVASLAPPASIPATTLTAGANSPALIATNFTPAANPAPSNFNRTPSRSAADEGQLSTNTGGLTGPSASASVPATSAPSAGTAAVTMNTQDQVAQEIHDLVQKTSNRTLGSIGLILLVITAVSLLRGIEETFNDMWGVTRGRNWWLQFMLYWFIITLGPLLLSTTLGLAGSAHLQAARSFLGSSPWLGPVLAQVLPIALLSFMLGCFYKLTPNTKVEFSAAMIGGLCAGIAWHGYNQLGFLLLSRAHSASALYGGLALVVLVMGGLYILWLILLFGAQIAYAYQNRTAYLQDRLAENVNQRGREFVALRIMTSLGRRFQQGLPPATVPEISAELGVPNRLTQSILRTLACMRLVTEVCGAEAAFVPARPLESINAYDILMAIRTGAGQELPMSELPELAEIYGEFARIEQAERNAAAGVTLFALANRMTPRLGSNEAAPAARARAPLGAPQISEPSITAACAPVTEKAPEPAPVEIPKPAPFPKKVETPEPVVEDEDPPRRETARPEEHTDFPL